MVNTVQDSREITEEVLELCSQMWFSKKCCDERKRKKRLCVTCTVMHSEKVLLANPSLLGSCGQAPRGLGSFSSA